MALLYAHMLRITIYSYTLSPMIPFGTLYSLVGLVMLYWLNKYLLIRRMVCKNFFSNQLCKQMLKYLQLSSILYAVSNFLIVLLPQYDQATDKWEVRYDRMEKYLYLAGAAVITALALHFLPLKFLSLAQLYKKMYQVKKFGRKDI